MRYLFLKFTIVLVELAGAVALLCWRIAPLLEEKPVPRPPTPKKALPIDQKIEAIGVTDLDGRAVSTADLIAGAAGKPLIVAFWSAT